MSDTTDAPPPPPASPKTPPRRISCWPCNGTGLIVVGNQHLVCGPCIGRGWRHG